MFESTGVLNKVEIEARTEVKWETYTKKIQIEGRVLGDLTMNHIVPIASRYEAMLLDKVYKTAGWTPRPTSICSKRYRGTRPPSRRSRSR